MQYLLEIVFVKDFVKQANKVFGIQYFIILYNIMIIISIKYLLHDI